jgi:uncharacterized protein YxeA
MYKAFLKSFACLLVLSLAPLAAWGGDNKIAKSDLTPAAQKTADEQSVGATIEGYSKEKKDVLTYFRVDMTIQGHSKVVLIARDGRLVETMEEIAMDTLPSPVHTGLQAKVKKGTIQKVFTITKDGKLVAYEALVDKAGKIAHTQVGLDGKGLDHEE